MNIKKEILAQLSDDALRTLISAATTELNSRLDFTLEIGGACYAIVKNKREDYLLNRVRRTKAEVTCAKTGKLYLIPLAMLKTDGRPRVRPITKEELASRTGVPISSASAASW